MNFGFPFSRFNSYRIGKYKTEQSKISDIHNENFEKNISVENDSVNSSNKRNGYSHSDVFFDVFGVKLYYDDVLLISLIFFLYSEGVEDNSLFIALVLLLLS